MMKKMTIRLRKASIDSIESYGFFPGIRKVSRVLLLLPKSGKYRILYKIPARNAM